MIKTTVLASLLISYGIPHKDVKMLTCIAIKESNMNPKARNLNRNGTRDHGLFQINDINKKLCKTTSKQLYNVHTNIKCAVKVYKIQNLKAWTTYKVCKKELKTHVLSHDNTQHKNTTINHSTRQEQQIKAGQVGPRRREIRTEELGQFYLTRNYFWA